MQILGVLVSDLVHPNFHDFLIFYQVDDGATDASGKIADAYSPLENVVVLHKKNGGLSEARNYGMKRLTGRYITFVDSDDYIPSKNAFDVMLDVAYEKNADIVAPSSTMTI